MLKQVTLPKVVGEAFGSVCDQRLLRRDLFYSRVVVNISSVHLFGRASTNSEEVLSREVRELALRSGTDTTGPACGD